MRKFEGNASHLPDAAQRPAALYLPRPSDPLERLTEEYLDRLGDPDVTLRRRAPQFLVISAPKTASTWLAENLRHHPSVFLPKAKELHYFNTHWASTDLKWYLNQFPDRSDLIKGEATPYGGLPLHAIRAIRTRFPELRLVVFLREPVGRSWSDIRHAIRFGNGRFEGVESFDEVSEQDLVEQACDIHNVNLGDYVRCLRRWRSAFEPSQILVRFVEDLARDPQAAFRSVLAHVGLDSTTDLSGFPLTQKVFGGESNSMPAGLEPFLRSLHATGARELAVYLRSEFGLECPDEWRSLLEGTDPPPLVVDPDYKGQMIMLHRGLFYAFVNRGIRDVSSRLLGDGFKIPDTARSAASLDEIRFCVDYGIPTVDSEAFLAQLFARPEESQWRGIDTGAAQPDHVTVVSRTRQHVIAESAGRFYAMDRRVWDGQGRTSSANRLAGSMARHHVIAAQSLAAARGALTPRTVEESGPAAIVELRGTFLVVGPGWRPEDLIGVEWSEIERRVAAGELQLRHTIEDARKVMKQMFETGGVLSAPSTRERELAAGASAGLQVAQVTGIANGIMPRSSQQPVRREHGVAVPSSHSSTQAVQMVVPVRTAPPTIHEPPELVDANWYGYNVVRYSGKWYALSVALGHFDLVTQDVNALQENLQVLVADDRSVVKQLARVAAESQALERHVRAMADAPVVELPQVEGQVAAGPATGFQYLDEIVGHVRQLESLVSMYHQSTSEVTLQRELIDDLRRDAEEKRSTRDALAQAIEHLTRARREDVARLAEVSRLLESEQAAAAASRADLARQSETLAGLEAQFREQHDLLVEAMARDASSQGELQAMKAWVTRLQDVAAAARAPRPRSWFRFWR